YSASTHRPHGLFDSNRDKSIYFLSCNTCCNHIPCTKNQTRKSSVAKSFPFYIAEAETISIDQIAKRNSWDNREQNPAYRILALRKFFCLHRRNEGKSQIG